MMADEHKSALALALEARERKVHPFDVTGFFGLGGKPMPQLAIRVPTKGEQDAAVVEAHRHAAAISGPVEAAKSDGDLLDDAKIVEVLFRMCRDANDPKCPAFPGPRWMRERLTTDQLGALMNLANEVRRAEAPGPQTIDDDLLEAFVSTAAFAAGSALPEAALAGCSREWLSQAFVLLSCKLQEARRELADAQQPPPPAEPPQEPGT